METIKKEGNLKDRSLTNYRIMILCKKKRFKTFPQKLIIFLEEEKSLQQIGWIVRVANSSSKRKIIEIFN